MIQALIDAAVRRLREELGELIVDPDTRVLAGPLPTSLARVTPRIVLSAGRLEIDPSVREGPAGAVRAQPAEERLEIGPTERGPFPLAHAPMRGTVRCGILLAEGTSAEHCSPLNAGSDFDVDYPGATLLVRTNLKARLAAHAADLRSRAQVLAGHPFNVDAPEELARVLFEELQLPPPGEAHPGGYPAVTAAVLEGLAAQHPIAPCVLAYWAARSTSPVVLRVEYSFPGVFTVREFQQALLVDVHGADGAEVSMLSSLTAAILLTDQEMLRQKAGVAYTTGRSVSSSHTLTQLDLAGGVPEPTEIGAHVRLTFRVAGNVKLMRDAHQGVGFVERIRPPETGASNPLLTAEMPFADRTRG